jgi:hypothetical protein
VSGSVVLRLCATGTTTSLSVGGAEHEGVLEAKERLQHEVSGAVASGTSLRQAPSTVEELAMVVTTTHRSVHDPALDVDWQHSGLCAGKRNCW